MFAVELSMMIVDCLVGGEPRKVRLLTPKHSGAAADRGVAFFEVKV